MFNPDTPAITVGQLNSIRERLHVKFEAADPNCDSKLELRGQLKLITELMLKHRA